MTSVQTTVTVDSTTGMFVGSYLLIESEAVLITNINSLTLTIKRGQCSTTAVWHNNTTTIHHFFGWRPFRETTHESLYPVIRVEMQGTNEQVQRKAVNKISKWEYQYQGLKSEMDAIKAFIDLRFGGWETFKWQDAEYQIHTVRLATDSLKIVESRSQENGRWEIVGYKLSAPIVFKKVNGL